MLSTACGAVSRTICLYLLETVSCNTIEFAIYWSTVAMSIDTVYLEFIDLNLQKWRQLIVQYIGWTCADKFFDDFAAFKHLHVRNAANAIVGSKLPLSDEASTSTFTIYLVFHFFGGWFSIGAIIWHGGHHCAQKSTSMLVIFKYFFLQILLWWLCCVVPL